MTTYYLLEDNSGYYELEDLSGRYLQEGPQDLPVNPPPSPLSTALAGGQVLTPYQNVYAPAGMGGSRWGANGGGDTPIFGPLPVLPNASRAIRQTNFIMDAKNVLTVQAGMSNSAVSTETADQVYADDSTSQVWTADMESPGVADSQL